MAAAAQFYAECHHGLDVTAGAGERDRYFQRCSILFLGAVFWSGVGGRGVLVVVWLDGVVRGGECFLAVFFGGWRRVVRGPESRC
ncbi:hypothetical protein GCM10023318_49870 [Nocardia callitridis]|uniref:Uncharacterized protein n=1 Tax=Nocardia callitridis TaxID=648753 RepID=A0ABP9KU42_9NOCA